MSGSLSGLSTEESGSSQLKGTRMTAGAEKATEFIGGDGSHHKSMLSQGTGGNKK
jgi:hypothetical protein